MDNTGHKINSKTSIDAEQAGASPRLQLRLDMLNDLGVPLAPAATVLDFGCGAGGVVQELRGLGYNAFGCDLQFKDKPGVESKAMADARQLRIIAMEPYVLPFEDNSFDCILSDQVLEHVQNYPETLRELKRVLKPGGTCLHLFPAKYVTIEPHVFVPFASVIRSPWWLRYWAKKGIRKEFQKDFTVEQTVEWNTNYLSSSTNYLGKRELKAYFAAEFENVNFCEKTLLRYLPRGKKLYRLSAWLPFIPWLYSTFRSRAVLLK